eukprot:TRINITY_DN108139_c0_g1_i1.p1 TRINITY_DN108139_c0_g1~~TRINITY_DN108139_c0_g1_i1.p1  ORF type:complete len:308 (+),score=53.10 TRINITY_DN108139_c0_g1_i1:62-985(+)
MFCSMLSALVEAKTEVVNEALPLMSVTHEQVEDAVDKLGESLRRAERERLLLLQKQAMHIYWQIDRRWHLDAWQRRQEQTTQQPGGSCLSCMKFHAGSNGFCSQCGRTWDMLCGSCGSCERAIETYWPEDVDAEVQRSSAASEAFQASLSERTDRAALQLAMPSRTFRHFLHSLRSAPAAPHYTGLAAMLHEFGHPLLSASQAAELLELLRSRGAIEMQSPYEHVLCSRVLDKWNLTKEKHGSGDCYYKPESWTHVNSSTETLMKVLKECGSNHAEACWDERMNSFVGQHLQAQGRPSVSRRSRCEL